MLDDFKVTFDRIFEYRPLSGEASHLSIERALRVGDAHSRQCDCDHRAGRDKRYLHSLLYCQPTSHRMNVCYTHVRKNAGDWCFGLLRMEYDGGTVSSTITKSQVLQDLVTARPFPTVEAMSQGNVYEEDLEEYDIQRLLTPIAPWGSDVDCKCRWTIRALNRMCNVCIYKARVKSGENNVEYEQQVVVANGHTCPDIVEDVGKVDYDGDEVVRGVVGGQGEDEDEENEDAGVVRGVAEDAEVVRGVAEDAGVVRGVPGGQVDENEGTAISRRVHGMLVSGRKRAYNALGFRGVASG